MIQRVDNVISDIFYNVQFNKQCHKKYMKTLKKCYEQSSPDKFWDAFVACFRIPLTIAQRHPHVENTLQFIASFAVGFYSCSESTDSVEPMCPFLSKLFNFLLTNHCAKDPSVRFRICHFLNMLLNTMGEQAFIDDALCDKITVSMMDRLLDKSPKVRAQAIFSLNRLQDPTDDQCPVIKMYIFHATKDPNAAVRKAAILCMGKNQRTLQVVLRRTRDVDETVRKAAFEFISKITVRSLTIKQRDQLLNDGLKDRSEIVQKSVKTVLLPAWLRHFKGEFISLVKALDAEIGTDSAVSALEILFKSSGLNTLLEQAPVDNETKLIPIKDLCSENVLYWKCLVHHLHRESCTDELERIIPELSKFCTYIADFVIMMSSKSFEPWEVHMQKFILLQLFEIASTYDLSDEVGRKKLNELICNTLMTNHCSEKLVECLVTQLEKVMPDVNARIDTLTHLISEIRLPMKEPQMTQVSEDEQHTINMQRAKLKVKLLELKEEEYQAIQDKDYIKADNLKTQINELNAEIVKLSEVPKEAINEDNREEKNDPETMIKCLTMICTMMQPVKTLTPTLRSLMQLALDSLDHADDNVHILALKALGIYCILDKELAKQHIMTFSLQFSLEQENQEIWIITLRAIFDLLLLYGLEYFDIIENTNESSVRQEKSRNVKLYSDSDCNVSLSSSTNVSTAVANCNFIKILSGLLDNANQGLRTVAAEGLCKLLLNQRISSACLLSRLIILCYNPANDTDFYMRQCLSAFFDNFVMRVPDSHEVLEEAYLPTLRILCSAPEISPLQDVDPYDVSQFILRLTRHRTQKSNNEICHPHNSFAFKILAELLNPDSKIDQEALIKSLKDLHVNIEDNTSRNNLLEALAKVAAMVNDTDKRLMKYVESFKKKLEVVDPAQSAVLSQQEEEENSDSDD